MDLVSSPVGSRPPPKPGRPALTSMSSSRLSISATRRSWSALNSLNAPSMPSTAAVTSCVDIRRTSDLCARANYPRAYVGDGSTRPHREVAAEVRQGFGQLVLIPRLRCTEVAWLVLL